nr:hypothetical protein [uncultured Carboxylicivirga sp.]
MKKILYLLLIGFILFLSSCSEELEQAETPGNIPGMGNTPGSIEVMGQITLPDGVVIDGDIKGSSEFTTSASAILKSEGGGDDHEEGGGCDHGSEHQPGQEGRCEHGSGGQWVAVDLTIVNTTDLEKEIILPAGCVFECQEDGYQHGILIQEIFIKIMGRGAINIKLNLYCLNRGKDGSNATLTYQLRGIASSKNMGHLTTKLEGKKIDVIYFRDTPEEYQNLISELQKLVWAITNDNGIDEHGWNFIDSIPDL